MDGEIALNFSIDPSDVARLRRFIVPPGWTRGDPKRKKLLSVYFDTEDLFLYRHGISLHVRRDGDRWIQTVTTLSNTNVGSCRRIKVEAQVAYDHPDFTKIDVPALRKLSLASELQGRLKVVSTAEFRRTLWMFESETGDVVEMALDQGEFGHKQTISEVELAGKAGNPAAVYEIALALLDSVPLCLEHSGDAQCGYALFAPSPPPPVKAPPLDFNGEVIVSRAFQLIAWSCIHHLQGNQAGLLSGEDVEYVHQMRVALRRLRCAMGLFAKLAPSIHNTALIEEIRWLAGELGAVRDWDVFVTEMLPPILSCSADSQPLKRLLENAQVIRMAHRESAMRAVGSQRYQQLFLRLCAWLYRESWRAESGGTHLQSLDRPILASSGRLLDKRHKQLLKHGNNPAGLSAAERHAMRIAAKKLRYAAEFLAQLYPAKASHNYLKALAKLQDILGVLNDHVVTLHLLDELGGQHEPDALHARSVGEICGWNACQASIRLAMLGDAWSNFRKLKPFWKRMPH